MANLRKAFLLLALLIGSDTSLFAQSDKAGGPPAAAPGGPVRRLLGPGAPAEPFPEAQAIPQPKTDEELAQAINKLADELAATGRFSGSIFVAAKGKTLLDKAWGEANRATNTPNTADTAFDVGSIGKLFTQIAIMQLAESGKLSLDDVIAKYLPDYPDKDVANKVTVRQLLLHTSGIPDFFDNLNPETAHAIKWDAVVELKDFLPLFVGKPLDFEPGSSNRYSNSGYIVLGLIIEATGEKYRDYIQRHILDPAGMKHSGFFDRSDLPPTVAHSYEGKDDVTNMHPRRGSPAGGLQATASDLYRLVEAVNDGKLVKPESIKVIRSLVPTPLGTPPPADASKLTAFGIQGGAPGVNTQLVIDPTGRYTRAVLCNSGPPMASAMGATIRAWIKDMPVN